MNGRSNSFGLFLFLWYQSAAFTYPDRVPLRVNLARDWREQVRERQPGEVLGVPTAAGHFPQAQGLPVSGRPWLVGQGPHAACCL